eukprot:CAMPEP_0184545556 /NCGR_PEP_ID=MMETSP0199_2-20130426/4380_1 /TAXON_ID=1112570 /ORGANISM="Thraustochytrium sp., Strain LLF1b" /LENGTH=572 /DNA_ID=CAMNT_0026939863 /DNA_START=234 /DNA_END=1948 /DNA_ORIENTATION=-
MDNGQQSRGRSRGRGGRGRGRGRGRGGGYRGGDGKAAKRPNDSNEEVAAKRSNMNSSSTPPPPPVAERQGGNAPKNLAHLSDQRFDSLDISEQSKSAIANVLKFQYMTIVQASTLPTIMQGVDTLAKARTGTGKTVGFLLPVIESLAKNSPRGDSISCLVIAPTRDLAIQVFDEGKALATYHNNVTFACIVGGLNKSKDLKTFNNRVDILVATPGRLNDHLQTTRGFVDKVSNLKFLVLDEADRLLDMGFRPELERILGFLPRNRQTLLFSATFPDSLAGIVKFALREDHKLIDTVGEETTQTNEQVAQESLIVPGDMHSHVLHHLLLDHVATKTSSGEEYKIMVFFPTARIVGFWSQLFNKLGMRVLEMHSRKSQSQRGKLVAEFRSGKNLIMFSSDVSARGLDFEGVSLIVQVGLTDREQYIHRLGRTARAGQSGRGVLMLAPFESRFLKELSDLPIKQADADLWVSKGVSPPVQHALDSVEQDSALLDAATKAYVTFLGFYINKSKVTGKSRTDLILAANTYSTYIGLTELPGIEARTAGKMGLKGCQDINIVRSNTAGGGYGGGGYGG